MSGFPECARTLARKGDGHENEIPPARGVPEGESSGERAPGRRGGGAPVVRLGRGRWRV